MLGSAGSARAEALSYSAV